MTISTTTHSSTDGPVAGGAFARTGGLLRFMLRRDRTWLSLWILGIAAMAFYVAHAVQAVAEDEETLGQIAGLITDPVGRMMTGPGFGMEDPTFERFFATGYVLYIYILIALMSMFLVVRHTRAEEQAGRAELIRSNVVGRHATLTSALSLALLGNLLLGLVVFLAAVSAGFAMVGSVLVAAGGITTGMFFAALAAVTSQLSESSRGANAMAGAVLAISYVIRMGGDMPEPGGTMLSWFSPLAWPQQTAPYVLDRWWPLLLPLAGALILAGLGYWLSLRRDIGASLVSVRPGRKRARRWLGTPLGVAYRTLRGSLRGWAIGLFLAGLMFGAYAEALIDAAEGLPEEFQLLMAGEDMMLGYLAYMALFMALFVAAAGVTALQVMRVEESRGRVEFLLSTPMSRSTWFAAHLLVMLVGLAALLLLAGLGTAIGATVVLGDAGFFWELLIASVHQAPPVLAVVGITAALFGWLPRLTGAIGWLLVLYGFVMENFGTLLEFPEPILNLSLFHHLASYPVENVTWAPILVLSGIGILGLLLGVLGWRRREVNRN